MKQVRYKHIKFLLMVALIFIGVMTVSFQATAAENATTTDYVRFKVGVKTIVYTQAKGTSVKVSVSNNTTSKGETILTLSEDSEKVVAENNGVKKYYVTGLVKGDATVFPLMLFSLSTVKVAIASAPASATNLMVES